MEVGGVGCPARRVCESGRPPSLTMHVAGDLVGFPEALFTSTYVTTAMVRMHATAQLCVCVCVLWRGFGVGFAAWVMAMWLGKWVSNQCCMCANDQTLQPVKALAVTRQELHTVTAGYPRMKEEFTRVARTMVSSFKLPIRLPATDAELKREASRSRRQSLSNAVKSGLWRRFSHVRGVAAAVVWA